MTFPRALHAAFVDSRIDKGSRTVAEALSPELEQASYESVMVLAMELVVETVLEAQYVDLC
jgi:hypothetical protein